MRGERVEGYVGFKQNRGYYAGYALTGVWPSFSYIHIDALKQLLKMLMEKFLLKAWQVTDPTN